MSQAGPTPAKHRKVPVPSTRCGRIFGREEGKETPLFLSPKHICMHVWVSQRERGAHLSSSSRVTLLHTRPIEAHLNTATAASNTRLHSQEETTVWAAFAGILNAHGSLWTSDQRLSTITKSTAELKAGHACRRVVKMPFSKGKQNPRLSQNFGPSFAVSYFRVTVQRAYQCYYMSLSLSASAT